VLADVEVSTRREKRADDEGVSGQTVAMGTWITVVGNV